MTEAVNLMKLCIPSFAHLPLPGKMEEAMEIVLSLIETNASSQFFEIYISLVFNSQQMSLSQNFPANLQVGEKYVNKVIKQVSLSSFNRH